MIKNTAQAIEMITGYIIECRNRGHFLPYSEHEIIEDWVKSAKDIESLLNVLEEVVPNYYSNNAHKTCPPRLESINDKIKDRLLESAMLKNNSKVI